MLRLICQGALRLIHVLMYIHKKTFVKLFSETIHGIDLKLGRIVWHDVLYMYVERDFLG